MMFKFFLAPLLVLVLLGCKDNPTTVFTTATTEATPDEVSQEWHTPDQGWKKTGQHLVSISDPTTTGEILLDTPYKMVETYHTDKGTMTFTNTVEPDMTGAKITQMIEVAPDRFKSVDPALLQLTMQMALEKSAKDFTIKHLKAKS